MLFMKIKTLFWVKMVSINSYKKTHAIVKLIGTFIASLTIENE